MLPVGIAGLVGQLQGVVEELVGKLAGLVVVVEEVVGKPGLVAGKEPVVEEVADRLVGYKLAELVVEEVVGKMAVVVVEEVAGRPAVAEGRRTAAVVAEVDRPAVVEDLVGKVVWAEEEPGRRLDAGQSKILAVLVVEEVVQVGRPEEPEPMECKGSEEVICIVEVGCTAV